jgi:hypothetical protein
MKVCGGKDRVQELNASTFELFNFCTLQLLYPVLPATHFHSAQLYANIIPMGNKDRRSREKKKPKKETPKLAPPPRATHQTTTPPVITRTPETS